MKPHTIVDSKINSGVACESDQNIDNHLHVESDHYCIGKKNNE